MQCKCGNEIGNVPEHLRDLATWVCAKCTNTSSRPEPLYDHQAEDDSLTKRAVRPKKAA
jgi:hypothetical protein